MNRALSWSCKLCSPISSRLLSGYLLAFRCESGCVCPKTSILSMCHNSTGCWGALFIAAQTYSTVINTSAPQLRCVWEGYELRMLGGHTDFIFIQNKTAENSLLCSGSQTIVSKFASTYGDDQFFKEENSIKTAPDYIYLSLDQSLSSFLPSCW